jgi:hypothetical protein
MRMRRIVNCGMPGSTAFFHIKQHDFRKKKLLDIKCVIWFSLQLLSEKFLIPTRIVRDMIKKSCRSPLEYPLFLSDFNKSWIFSTGFRKVLRYQISWKSVQWQPSCSMRADGWTDMTKLIVAFRNFAKASKKNDTGILSYLMWGTDRTVTSNRKRHCGVNLLLSSKLSD